MSLYHCSCGCAADSASEFGDHFREVFIPADETGTDGQVHTELTASAVLETMTGGASPARILWFRLQALIRSWTRRPGPCACLCGYGARAAREMDDHFLMVFTPPGSAGLDGLKHVPVDPSTPVRWFVSGHPDSRNPLASE